MKKLLIPLAILLLVSLVLLGCSRTTTTTRPTTTTPGVTPTTTSTQPTTTGTTTTSQTTGTTTRPPTSITTTATPPTTTTTRPTTTSSTTTSTTTATTPTSTAGAPKYGGVLKVLWDSVPPTSIGYPPDLIADASSCPQLNIEGLLREDYQGKLSPWLAESYKVADDLKFITFTLRKGVKFHDGSDLNAQVAKWNLDNRIAAKLEPFWSSVDVLDDYTVRVNLSQWRNTILRSFGDGPGGWMISKAAFDKNGIDWIRANPTGTGPFKFVSFARDTSYKTVKNPNYWQQGKPYLDGVEIVFVSDLLTQQAVMKSGAADMMILEPGKMAYDMANAGLTVVSDIVTNFSLVPDTANPDSPLANQKVREATEYAIDREAIAKALGYGYWEAPYQFPAKRTVPYDPNYPNARKYDPDKAKQLLREAGYPNGVKIKIIVAAISVNRDVDVAIKSYLDKVGIQTDLEFPEATAWQNYNTSGWRNAYVFQPLAGFANFNATYNFYLAPTSINNKSWLRSPAFLDAFTKTVTSPTLDVNLMRAVANVIHDEASIIPVIQVGRGWAYYPYVKNAGWLERGLSPYWKPEQAWLDK